MVLFLRVLEHGLGRSHKNGLESIGPVMYGPEKEEDGICCAECDMFSGLQLCSDGVYL